MTCGVAAKTKSTFASFVADARLVWTTLPGCPCHTQVLYNFDSGKTAPSLPLPEAVLKAV